MNTQSKPMADVRDMYMAHTAFRREFGLLPGLILNVAEGDTWRSEVVGSHVDLMCRILHIHHEGEDAVLWPLLLERDREEAERVVPTMRVQHAGIEDALAKVTALLGPWRSTAHGRAALAVACGNLTTAITEHMTLEEQRVLPLAEKYVTNDEWRQMGAHGQSRFSRQELPLVFGMAMYEAEPGVVRGVLADAPLQARLLVPYVAPRAYARHSRRVHGTATPPRAATPVS